MTDYDLYPISMWVMTVVPLTFAVLATSITIFGATLTSKNRENERR